jgi:aarF domain-containing kinase
VGESIASDLEAVRLLLNFGNFLPKGLYLDNTIRVAKQELSREVDYLAEALATKRFGQLLADDPLLRVPAVCEELCTKRVLVSEMLPGVPMGRLTNLPQSTRNRVRCLNVCLEYLN